MIEEIYGIAIVPLIVGLIELCKISGLPQKLAPIVSVGIGLAIAFAYGLTDAGWTVLQSVLVGITFGLMAVGLYSGVKNVSQQFTGNGK